jgi:serine/threonine protein kinase
MISLWCLRRISIELMKVNCQNSGDVLSLDTSRPISRGGEGIIFPVLHRDDVAAKIYHPGKMSGELSSKLQTMVSQAPRDPMQDTGHPSIAWPLDLLREVNGNQAIVGFLMPRIHQAKPIRKLYSVATRTAFPDFTYRAVWLTAFNVATAIWAIHEAGYVVGDVNDANILVTDNALITLVDTDSFQITNRVSGQIYRCTVATPLFTAPETFKRSPESVDRSSRQDMFSLAILFFRLLMEGTQPYAGKIIGQSEAPDCVERLRMGGFPYSGLAQFLPSRFAPPFEMLPPSIQELFRRSFVEGHGDPSSRPDAATWARTLKRCESSFVTCRANPRHDYFNHCTVCPWCERRNKLKTDSFPARHAAGTPFTRVSTSGPAQASQPISTSGPTYAPTVNPPIQITQPARFHASAASVFPGQPVTLHWSLPNGQGIQIRNRSGRRYFDSNSPNGQVTVYPAKSETYQLVSQGLSPNMSPSVAVAVTQLPLPVALKRVTLELRQLLALHDVQSDLRSPVRLNPTTVSMPTPVKLRNHVGLGSYNKLKRNSVALNPLPLDAVRTISLLGQVRTLIRRIGVDRSTA